MHATKMSVYKSLSGKILRKTRRISSLLNTWSYFLPWYRLSWEEMATLLRLHSLFETLSTVGKLQTKSRAQESHVTWERPCLFFACLFVFCNWLFCCCFSFLMLKFYYIYVTFFSHTQSSSVLTARQRACLGITGVHSLVSNFADRLDARVIN